MLPRTSGRLLLFSALMSSCAAFVWPAQQSQPPSPAEIRYHFGDNPAWADPLFDDSAWPKAQGGTFPAPAYQSDGFFWVRARLEVPAGAAGSLAIESHTLDPFPNVQELWVNGRIAGRNGDFPPHAKPLNHLRLLVFDIPAGVVQPSSVAVVALRAWNAPDDRSGSLLRRHPDPVSVTFSIDSAPLLHALESKALDSAWLRFWPQLSLTLIFIMLGLAVLALGVWARDRTLLLCALWLVALPAYLVFRLLPLPEASASTVYTVFLIINAVGMLVMVEFTWTVQGFRDRIFRTIIHLCWIGLTVGFICAGAAMHPGTPVSAGALTGNWLLFAFNVIGSGANLIALAGRGRNRPVAAALLLISVGYFLDLAGYPVDFSWLGIGLFRAAFYVCTLFIAVLLMRQTWTAWRKAEDLRVEFAAARELQQQLVPLALPKVAGLELEAVYLPAQEVGGDFYQVMEQSDGVALILVGDVSGKGLKAAMTGVLTIGAAQVLAGDGLGPAALLTRLNQEMKRSSKEGFVTCLCARVARDGTLTLANAGHLAPYRNGEEMRVESGLPLGIAAGVEYIETTLHLTKGDSLTFLSDGVVEAQNAAGELFGFARTEALATKRAKDIAQAAQAFGQADDITVLTLAFVSVPAALLPAPA